MALDGLFLHCIGQELENAVIGAKVDKVYQPSSEELVLTLRSRDLGALKLLLCARANSPRIHLTKATFENPATPPMLCMLLRKRLGGATLTGIRQAGFDRILFLDFSATNELGDKETLTIAMEIMAQYSNVILLGPDGKIIDALKRVDLTRSSKRLILPGLAYELPPQQDKLALPDHSVEELVARIREFRSKTLSSAVLSSLQGVSPALAREVAFRSLGEDKHLSEMTEDDFVDLEYPLLELKKEIASPTHTFCVVRDDSDKPFEFSFWDLKQYGPSMATDHYETASELLDDYYARRDSMERIAHKSSDLRKLLNNATERIARKVEVQRGELAKSVDREKLRVYAELINANLYQLEKGVLYYDLENYYDENRILRVPADPALSPAQNSQKYYKDYRKTYTAEKKLTEQIEQGTEELAYLETVKDALSKILFHQQMVEQNEEKKRAAETKTTIIPARPETKIIPKNRRNKEKSPDGIPTKNIQYRPSAEEKVLQKRQMTLLEMPGFIEPEDNPRDGDGVAPEDQQTVTEDAQHQATPETDATENDGSSGGPRVVKKLPDADPAPSPAMADEPAAQDNTVQETQEAVFTNGSESQKEGPQDDDNGTLQL